MEYTEVVVEVANSVRTFKVPSPHKQMLSKLNKALVDLQMFSFEAGDIPFQNLQEVAVNPTKVVALQQQHVAGVNRVAPVGDGGDESNVPQWAAERCVAANGKTTNKVLYADYKQWCTSNGKKPEVSTVWGRHMAANGFEKYRQKSERGFKGIQLV